MSEAPSVPRCPHCNGRLDRGPLRHARLGLTPKMREALEVFALYIEKMGYAPSYNDIALMLGISSRSGVHRLVKSLEERGWLYRAGGAGRARTLALAEEAAP